MKMPPRRRGLNPGPSRGRLAECRRQAEEVHARNREIVAGGVCPNCGTRLKRNTSLAGWWQCQASVNEQFRDADLRGVTLPRCSFQCFTE